MAEITPVTLLLGLPGADPRTVLQDALRQPEAAGVAVVATQPDPPTWWNAGCRCCTPRDDVARALRQLLPQARRDEVRRVVIAAAGPADPGAFLATLLSDMVAAAAYRLDTIVMVADSAGLGDALDRQDGAVRQVTAADRIMLTGSDRGVPAAVAARLRRVNPTARPIDAVRDPGAALRAGIFAPAAAVPDLRGWLDADMFAAGSARAASSMQNPTDSACRGVGAVRRDAVSRSDQASRCLAASPADATIQAHCLVFASPLPAERVTAWLERLILAHGDSLLRMKGILHLNGEARPVAIHSLQHQLHPPQRLPAWPVDDARSSRIAFITRGLSPAILQAGQPAAADTSGR